ncbi:hypothetical protein A2533_03915 [Candidatus Falkowbacteria bacterium RIFOXYD2_FULL_35_9]|uniref:4Fe-4S ferredoxin-type domain-containing protein n=1 Tax=Candidatus Falkowbacteria bacterium RIFOXYC2_FULL_36_12 TaxID=1798002 RepID=A0A1F5T2U8_9BACT|nr:MAG: hypothetical protein A2300_01215 [Candidatus Falkowbacteria bacterium RIFOXYB2_FULL_35_7]OGF33304.1 MAG: hypothetical protein A2478_01195 [Candidatus Falkowbacteria bacterium RIFOXYC2_FULL_36_12]OGF34854.1 MAG: hypothetical protein A2223_00330 [Candidatus Falkowbacteria bacterium RIFOXYA2_FULL_35_8]OGF48573.1 MAG: hypothetical protein A2533_03915 [Candidatus Falkowbacteria bacterium RIFOXYD2_FULL_35_9]
MKINITAESGATKINKTGPWRVQYPVIEHEKCIACGLCARVCPEGCVFLVEEKEKKFYEKDLDYCKGCSVCAVECPVKCIQMFDEDK